MKWADWMPTKYSVLCEKHFTTDKYINKGEQVIKDQSKKYLKQNAVPSIFDNPPHLVKTTTSRPLPKKREAPPPLEDQIPAKKKRKSSVNSDHGSYIKSPATVMKKLNKTLKKKNNKIRSLSAKNLRKEKTIKGLVKKLEEIKALSEEQSQHLISNFGHMTKYLFTNE